MTKKNSAPVIGWHTYKPKDACSSSSQFTIANLSFSLQQEQRLKKKEEKKENKYLGHEINQDFLPPQPHLVYSCLFLDIIVVLGEKVKCQTCMN